ncbi:MAG: Gfo/Idh/MocA family protein [Planctomycetota bacterium]|jgi:predicted dehydrogenase
MKRRTFLYKAAGTMAASTLFPGFAIGKSGTSPNSKVNVAFIGSGGWIARQPYEQGCKGENLVAFCDVDRNHCAENMKNWRTNQPFFDDYRVMFDKMGKQIDAVVASTPDHSHFPATIAAMERGIHVYTQKPLAHNVWQTRTLVKAKNRYKVMTQMGNQGHAGAGIRKSVEAYRAGVIGEISEVYTHNGGPEMGGNHFANPKTMPPPASPVPEGLSWDLWIGPAKMRPFYKDYLPYKWRAFYDFGLGMLGDWGCHTLDTPVWAGSRIKYYFPAKGKRGPVTLYWIDGPQDWTKVGRIDKFGAENATYYGRACWMVGTRGMLGCGTHAGQPTIIPTPLRKQWQANPPKQSIPRVEGGPFREWLRAIKGTGPEPGSNFSYSANLTEIILLGVLAQRFNTRIEWDAKNARITNRPKHFSKV